MFTFVAATLFSAAFILAVGTMTWMFTQYRDKMVAALLFQPIPQDAPVYRVRINRTRVIRQARTATLPLPVGALAA